MWWCFGGVSIHSTCDWKPYHRVSIVWFLVALWIDVFWGLWSTWFCGHILYNDEQVLWAAASGRDITWKRESRREERASGSRDARLLLAKSTVSSFLLASSTQMLPRCILPVSDGWGLPLFEWCGAARRWQPACSYADAIRWNYPWLLLISMWLLMRESTTTPIVLSATTYKIRYIFVDNIYTTLQLTSSYLHALKIGTPARKISISQGLSTNVETRLFHWVRSFSKGIWLNFHVFPLCRIQKLLKVSPFYFW